MKTFDFILFFLGGWGHQHAWWTSWMANTCSSLVQVMNSSGCQPWFFFYIIIFYFYYYYISTSDEFKWLPAMIFITHVCDVHHTRSPLVHHTCSSLVQRTNEIIYWCFCLFLIFSILGANTRQRRIDFFLFEFLFYFKSVTCPQCSQCRQPHCACVWGQGKGGVRAR